MGFKVQGSSKIDKVNCYCPCSRHMEPWRAQFFLTDITGKGSAGYCETSKGIRKMVPCGLMGHLESDKYKNCLLHFGLKAYLWALYGKYHGYVGHKRFYKRGDVNYKKSEADENQKNNTKNEVSTVN